MIIGLSGKIGSGKDTAGHIIKELSPASNWEIKKFAYKLKSIASILTGIEHELFEDQEFKSTNLANCWNIDDKPTSVRTFLQLLGTDAIRDHVHQNAWVNALFADYNREGGTEGGERTASDGGYYSAPSYPGNYPNWIITDVRFLNEAEAIRSRKGILIRLDRASLVQSNHPSETALDDYLFDHRIDNNGSLEDLRYELNHILEYYG